MHEDLTVDRVFPQTVERPLHYVDWFTDRVKIDQVKRLFKKLERDAEVADLVPIQMRESVDPTLIPSAVKEIDMIHSNLREFDQNTVVKVWLTAHILAWYDPHESQRRKLFNTGEVLKDVVKDYEAAYRRFKLRWEVFYINKYSDAKTSAKEGEDSKSTLARDQMILETGRQAQSHYDRIRDQLWDIENVISSILQASQSYREGGGLSAFDKRSREIMDSRSQKETVMIERTSS